MCHRRPTSFLLWAVFSGLFCCGIFSSAERLVAQDSVANSAPGFSKDVLPILRNNCIACHNIKQAEGGLNLESVDGILAGGDSGEMVSVAEPHGSLLLARARGEVDSIMPPEDNSVGAKPLTEAEMLILEQWIAAGAKADADATGLSDAKETQWQPLPENLRSVYALSASPTQPVVAVGRGNTIALVDANTGVIHAQLFDAKLQHDFDIRAAHLDFVNALAFSPNGDRLVSGGYRTLKVWRRSSQPEPLGRIESLVGALVQQAMASSIGEISDQQRQQVTGWLKTSEQLAGKSADELELVRWRDNQRRLTEHGEFLKGLVGPVTERITKEEEAKKKAEEAHAKKVEELNEKRKKAEEATAKVESLKTADPPASDEQKMAADKELEAATAAVESGEKELAAVAQALASAKDVHQRAVDHLSELNAEVAANAAAVEQLRVTIEQRNAEVERKSIAAIGYTADQTLAAAVVSDGSIVVFDTSNGQAISRLAGASTNVAHLMIVDNWLIAVETMEGEQQSAETHSQPRFRVWNLDGTWELERVIGTPDGESPFVDRITALDFSPDGRWLVVGGGEPSRTGVVTVMDTNDFSITSTWDQNHSDIVLSLKVSPDASKLASSGADKQIRVVDFPSGQNVRSLEGHTHHVLGVAWQDHGRRLGSVSADQTIKIWNVRTGEAERTIKSGGKELSGIAFMGTTSQIAVSSGEAAVRLYNADNGGQIRVFNKVQGFQQSVAADPAGKWIAAGSTEGGIRVWPVEAVEPRVVLD